MLKLEPEELVKFRSKLELCIDLINRELQQSPTAKINTEVKDLICNAVDLLEQCKHIS